MEKYIVIIILVVLVYYVHRYCIYIEIEKILKTKEGFAATSGSDADVASSINTLAQIAKDLQAGGLTVPGALNIKSVINTDGNITTKGAINASGGITCNAITSGPITAKGLVNATNGSTFTGGRHFFKDEENKGRLRVGAAWGKPGIYAEDSQDLILGASSTITHIGPPNEGNNQHLNINGNLTVKGNITVDGNRYNNLIYRKHDVAGYLHIRWAGWKVPLYYGVNFLWNIDGYAQVIKEKYAWSYYMLHYSGVDFRSCKDGDINWHPTFLTVFPGYKARLYYYFGDDKHVTAKQPSFKTGEWDNFIQKDNRLHIVYVALKEEDEPVDTISW